MATPIDEALRKSGINDMLIYYIEGTEKNLSLVMASPKGQTMSFLIGNPYISIDDFFALLSEKYNLGTPDEIKEQISKLMQ